MRPISNATVTKKAFSAFMFLVQLTMFAKSAVSLVLLLSIGLPIGAPQDCRTYDQPVSTYATSQLLSANLHDVFYYVVL